MSKMCASYLSLAGNPHGKLPRFSAIERAKAAHAAGIPSIGVLWNEPLDPAILRYVQVPEAEWFDLSEVPGIAMIDAMRVLRNDYGVTMIKTGLCAAGFPLDDAARNLTDLMGFAATCGLTVAVEPVAWGSAPSLGDTLALMRAAGVDNRSDVGVCYDLWQLVYGSTISERYYVPSLAKIEVSGVSFPDGTPLQEAAMDRPLLADSMYDTRGWVSRITAPRGVPVTYEVPNAHLRNMPLLETAQAIAIDMEML